ncbi:xanthine dehydrogenase family protein molybdopterin-binding subunit [Betaproteobacteria bacterium LSUCC0117]|nr:xanthine dehydrogenase family protein molybdopterin-binding subunit [Betaproteobacteria bacterium LSUCC0117]
MEVPSQTKDAATTERGYIGQSAPRVGAKRLLEGRGAYIDDMRLPRLAHVVYVRSPHAHALIKSMDLSAVKKQPGVIGAFTGSEIAAYCTPWVGVLGHLKGIKSAPQHAVAIDRACWQGEPVAAIVAQTRRQAEDALHFVQVDYEVLPVIVEMADALKGDYVIHPELGDNICFQRELKTDDFDEAFAKADVVVEKTFKFARHTGVTNEPRAVLADYQPADHSLTVYQATQAPHMMQDIMSRHLGIPESNVRIVCKDVGGSFGIKVHVYPDEMATAALSVMLKRPVKFMADRLESFLSDIHAREHIATVRMACTKEGDILGFDLDDLTGIGPYSVYPRTSGIEGNQVVNLTGGPYKHKAYRAKLNVVFTNKNVTCQYRAVGHPIAVALTEGIVDEGARALGMDPAAFRRRNLIADDAYPYTFPSGLKFEKLSHHQCLDKLLQMMDYDGLRAEQKALREKGIYRGIGLAAMIEVTNPSPAFYGVGGARISAQDGATLRLDPSGMLNVLVSVTEQGQGTEAVFAQIAASMVGVSLDKVRVITGDTAVTPYGGGTWASRGAGIGGEAVLQAGKALKTNILAVAGAVLSVDPATLDVVDNAVVDRLTRVEQMPLAEVGRVAYFRPDTLPMDFQSELTVTRHYTPREFGFTFTNGIQASYVEVDTETGFIKLLKHWCVEDCGTVLNPMLVDEQLRGGVVQGLGGALLEECLYSPEGQMLNGSMADYLVPMAYEMPDIEIGHVSTPTKTSELGAKGAGEAGTAGAPGAVMNAVNDALEGLGERVVEQPMTPERILKALGKI